jgi:serine/threonine-protein kinase
MLSGHVPFSGESPTVIMMKQVQDQPPSILDSRPDLPVAVWSVISRALAKQPTDRQQTAGELSKDLADVASADESSHIIAAPATVPMAPVAPVDDDEATLVRPRESEFLPAELAPMRSADPAPPAGIRPWRILAPAAIVLVAVFALVFFLTRGSVQNQSANANVNAPGLMADPNSQAVQPAGTPTGESERNIQAQPISSATPLVGISNANANSSANANTREQSTPATVNGNFGSNSNRNANLGEAPTPRPTPRQVDEAPTPKATPVGKVVPKPTASPIDPN